VPLHGPLQLGVAVFLDLSALIHCQVLPVADVKNISGTLCDAFLKSTLGRSPHPGVLVKKQIDLIHL